MNDSISRQAAIDALGEEPLVWDEYTDEWELAQRAMWREHFKALRELPTVQERKRGKWIEIPDEIFASTYKCSECGEAPLSDGCEWVLSNYCPNCGADMRGDKDD